MGKGFVRYLSYLFVINFLSGCVSSQGHYYLINQTNFPAEVRAVLDEELISDALTNPFQGGTWIMPYSNNLETVTFESFNSFTSYLEVLPLDNSRLAFSIPPKSTLFLGYGIDKTFMSGFDQCVIVVNGIEKSLSIQNSFQMTIKFESRKKYVGYFNIEH